MMPRVLTNYCKTTAMSLWMNSVGGRGDFSELKEKTTLVYPGALDPDTCERAIAAIERILDLPSHPRVWRDAEDSDARIFGFEKVAPELTSAFQVDQQMRRIETYLGRRFRSWCLMANRVVPRPDNLGSGGGFHRDSPFCHQVKCIWYLNDVTEQNGPFCYVPGTHMRTFRMRHTYPLGEMRFHDMTDAPVDVCAPAGSLVVCDTKCIHGGKPIKAGVRYAITLYPAATVEQAQAMFTYLGLDARLV